MSISGLTTLSARTRMLAATTMLTGMLFGGALMPATVAQAQTSAQGQSASMTGAQDFIADMAERGIGFLGNAALDRAGKQAKFRQLLEDSFDMKTIGRFVVGRYWRQMSPAQQQEYQELFRNKIVETYSARFSEYTGQKFETRSARPDQNSGDVIVTSFIVPKQGPEVKVDWRVRNRDGVYKVVDVIVEGVSMSLTQRSDFASVIQRGGGNVEVLLNHLRSGAR